MMTNLSSGKAPSRISTYLSGSQEQKQSANSPFFKQQVKNLSSPKQILGWISLFKHLPHCGQASCYERLSDGIAFAQILSTIMPPSQLKNELLGNITISNIDMRASIKNFKVVLRVLTTLSMKKAQNYTAEQICQQTKTLILFASDFQQFYEDNQKGSQTSTKAVTREVTTYSSVEVLRSSQRETYSYPQGLQQLSEIANISSNQLHVSKQKQRQQTVLTKKQVHIIPQYDLDNCYLKADQAQGFTIEGHRGKEAISHCDENSQFGLSAALVRSLKDWLEQHTKLCFSESQPHQILAVLINSLHVDRLHPEPIIKDIHFEMGSLSVWKKISHHFSTVERLKKSNVIQLIHFIESEGIVHQKLFWLIVQDLREMANGKTINRSKSKNSSRIVLKQKKLRRKNTKTCEFEFNNEQFENKENIVINKKPNQSDEKLCKVSQTMILEAEKWLEDLGFIHSLAVSHKKKELKNQARVLQSPVLNGNLIGSLLMRLQIGKPTLIKEPQTLKQVDRNLQQILRISLNRGYGCVRDFIRFKGSYNQYMAVIIKIKQLFEDEKEKQKQVSQSIFLHKKHKNNAKQLTEQIMQEKVGQWLVENFQFSYDSKKQVSCQQLNHVCSLMFKLTLYRETTRKIQLQNVNKILEQLRRYGLSKYYWEKGQDYIDPEQGNQKRWNILVDLFIMFGNK